MQLDPPIGAISDQQARRADHQEAHGSISGPASEHQADEYAQKQDVAQGICDRGQLGEEGHVLRVHVRLDQIDPRQHTESRRDDERIQQRTRFAVPSSAAPDHQDQPRGQEQVGGQIEDIGE